MMSHVGCANRLGKKKKKKNVSYVQYGRVNRMLFASCLGEQTAVHSVYIILYGRVNRMLFEYKGVCHTVGRWVLCARFSCYAVPVNVGGSSGVTIRLLK